MSGPCAHTRRVAVTVEALTGHEASMRRSVLQDSAKGALRCLSDQTKSARPSSEMLLQLC